MGGAGGKAEQRDGSEKAHHPLLLLHAHASSSSESKEGKGSRERQGGEAGREMGGAY